MEKRSFTRIVFRSVATVSTESQSAKGEIENLSLNGLLLKTQDRLAISTPVEVMIVLSGRASELSLKIEGTILRHSDDGMAVQFKGMELDCFIHLKNIVAYNHGDEERVMKEFFDFMKFNKNDLISEPDGEIV